MNKLPMPKFRDLRSIEELTNNKRIKNHSILFANKSNLFSAYKNYIRGKGNLFARTYAKLPKNVEAALLKLYASPPLSHKMIDKLRENDSTSLCPMCGSMHRGTLDHVLPKADWPEFSILIKNLVPACKCNQMKGNVLPQNSNMRILHPYFDKILSERLISAKIENLGETPNIYIRITKKNTHPLYNSIKFHVDNVVLKNNIEEYIKNRWESFYLYPQRVVREITPNIKNKNELLDILKKELKLLDEYHDGKNNWNSVFICGLIDINVVTWLLTELQNPKRDRLGRLIKPSN